MKTTIHILCATNNNFIMLLAAMIKSIEKNHKTDEILLFHIIDDKLSLQNRIRLEASTDMSKSKIDWISVETVWPKHLRMYFDTSSFPMIVNARLFMSHFLHRSIEKVIYLDVDLIFQHEISDLWNTNLENHIAGGVVDQRIKNMGSWGGIKQYKEIGMQADDPYYNSGVLLIDTCKWRDSNIGEKALDCLKKYNIDSWPDQHALNIVLHKKWLTLDPLWNHFAPFDHENPYIIHFIETKPIFKSYHFVDRYKQLFFEYLKMTEWNDFKPLSGNVIILRKIRNKLQKKLRSVMA